MSLLRIIFIWKVTLNTSSGCSLSPSKLTMHFWKISYNESRLLLFLFFFLCVCVGLLFFKKNVKAAFIGLEIQCILSWNQTCFSHSPEVTWITVSSKCLFFYSLIQVQCKTQVDSYCTGHRSTDTVIHWPTERQKTEELQTNLVTDAISLPSLSVSLSFALTQKHTCLETLRHCRHCHDLMYWNVHFTSTENAGQ